MFQACEVQSLSGGYFRWDLAEIEENRSMRKGMRRIGGEMVSVDGHHPWSNSKVIIERIGYEKKKEALEKSTRLHPDEDCIME